EPVAPADHVDRHAALIQVDQEAAKTGVERVDVVEQPEDVGLTPGQDLPSDPKEDGPLLEIAVGQEQAIPLAGEPAEAGDPLVDEGRGNLRAEQARDGRQVEADGPQLVALLAELRGPVVVDALALPSVLEAVLEGAQVEPAERAGKPLAAGGEP